MMKEIWNCLNFISLYLLKYQVDKAFLIILIKLKINNAHIFLNHQAIFWPLIHSL